MTVNALPSIEVGHGLRCTEVFNNCRTLAYLRAGLAGPYELNHDGRCPVCCCPTLDGGGYTTPDDLNANTAPWYDPAIPASAEAIGVLLDHDGFEIEGRYSARLIAEGGNRRITLTGSWLATTPRGLNYLKRWGIRRLENCCGESCEGVAIRYYEHCLGEGEIGCKSTYPVCPDGCEADCPDPRCVELDECPEGCSEECREVCCRYPTQRFNTEPDLIEDAVRVGVVDSGERNILSVKLVSVDDLVDASATACSSRFVIVLEILRDTTTGCLLDSCHRCEWDESWCEPNVAEAEPCDPLGCDECGVPCRCTPDVEEELVGPGLPTPTVSASEPPGYPTLLPKPVIEPPPPDCPETVQCAIDNGMKIDLLTGYIDLAASGIPTTGTYQWAPGGSSPNWLYRMIEYFKCMGVTYDSADAGTVDTLDQFLAGCTSVAGANQVSVQMDYYDGGGIGGIRFAPTTTPGDFGAADCNFILNNPPAMSIPQGWWVGEPYSAADLDCFIGKTCVKPLYNGEEIGDFIFPFDGDGLAYDGQIFTSGPDLAAYLTAERGCDITWNDEFHPTDPCSYCVPNDCPREVIPNLTTPPSCIRPTVDGVETTGPIAFPKTYNTIVFDNGPDLAAYLSSIRGCEITWDASTSTYCVPPDCARGPIVNLTTAGSDAVVDEECFVRPDRVIRQACMIPAVSRSTDLASIIRVGNGRLPISNATLRIYDFVPNLPHILNRSLGGPAYHSLDPVAEFEISGLPPRSELIFDGSTRRIRQICADGSNRSAGSVVFGPGRSPARMPELHCGGYWVELALSCETSDDGEPEFGALDATLSTEVYEAVA